MWENLKTQLEHRDKAKEEQVSLYAAWPLSAIIIGFSLKVEFHLLDFKQALLLFYILTFDALVVYAWP